MEYTWDNGAPKRGILVTSDSLARVAGPGKEKLGRDPLTHKDIARSAQAMYEEAFFPLLNALHRRISRWMPWRWPGVVR